MIKNNKNKILSIFMTVCLVVNQFGPIMSFATSMEDSSNIKIEESAGNIESEIASKELVGEKITNEEMSTTSDSDNAHLSDTSVGEKSQPKAVKAVASSEYAVDLIAPSDVDFASSGGYNGYTYQVVVNSEANENHLVSGVELNFTPPAGYVVDSIPTGPDGPVKSYTVNADGSVTIILNDIAKGIEQFSISVVPVTAGKEENNVNHRYDGEELKGTITGNSTPTGVVPESDTITILHGSTEYVASKTAKVSPGTSFRTVTYSFDVNSKGTINQISLQDLILEDKIPAGAVIVSSEDAGGKWTIAGDQSSGWLAMWKRDGVFTGNQNKLSVQDGEIPKLVVKYPMEFFPTGVKPPQNVVDLSGHDHNPNENDGEGNIWIGEPGKAQGPELGEGEADSYAIEKKISNKTWLSGSIYASYEVTGSYVGDSGSTTNVKEMQIEDDKDKLDNDLFWEHFLLSKMTINFNKNIIGSGAEYTLEYKTNQNTWKVADTGKTLVQKTFGFHVAGSINYQKSDNLDKEISLLDGEVLTGWRVIVKDSKGQSISRDAQATITVAGVPSYANIYTREINQSVDKITNTASQKVIFEDNQEGESTSAATATVKPNLNLNTIVEAPKSLETGKKSNYKMWASNVTPEEDVDGAIVRVVLPTGVTLDTTAKITVLSEMLGTPYNVKVPKPYEDIDIKTEILPSSGGYSGARQVVVFKFKQPLPSLRNAESASDRTIENAGFSYDIPVNVSQIAFDAYQENGNAPVESWITTDSTSFTDYSVSAYGKRTHQDTHDFDKKRESIVWDNKNSEVISKGGLFLSKSVEGKVGSGFSESAEVLYGTSATWKLVLSNTLVSTLSNPVVFDNLSQINQGSQFVTELAGPITSTTDATIEYSKDATTIDNGTWTTDWQEAKAFRISFSDLKANDRKQMTVPVKVPETAEKGDFTINTAFGSGELNGKNYPLTSNNARINVIVPPGDVVLTKTDADAGAVLEGAVFELQDQTGKVLESGLKTDALGQLKVSDLAIGTYQFVETKAPIGYQLDKTPIRFEIKKGQTEAVQVTMKNKLIPGEVILTKTDELSQLVLEGAIFELQDDLGKVIQSGLTTDSSGKISVSDLGVGSYQFIETKAPTGYELDKTPVKFEIKKGQTEAIQVTMTNKMTKGAVILTKKDSKSGDMLQGAVFELLDSHGEKLQDSLVTDKTGKLNVRDLEPGHYQLVETAAPTGYELDQTPVKFEIKNNQSQAVQVSMTNELIRGSVILEKIDDKTGERLAGAEFRLETKSGEVLIEQMVTDSSGKLAVLDLGPGTYSLIETKAPAGYELDATPMTFAVEKDSAVPVVISKVNSGLEHAVKLEKTDRKTDELLEGAEFELRTRNGKVLQKGLKTDGNGTFELLNMAPDDYQLVETKAPMGYDLDNTPILFSVKMTDQLVTIHFVNEKLPTTSKPSKSGNYAHNYLPQTGEKNNQLWWLLGLFIVVIISTIFLIRNKRK